jgi:hypothetical protein
MRVGRMNELVDGWIDGSGGSGLASRILGLGGLERGARNLDAAVKTRVEFNLFTGLTHMNARNIPVRPGFPRGRGKRRPWRARSPGPCLLASTLAGRIGYRNSIFMARFYLVLAQSVSLRKG